MGTHQRPRDNQGHWTRQSPLRPAGKVAAPPVCGKHGVHWGQRAFTPLAPHTKEGTAQPHVEGMRMDMGK